MGEARPSGDWIGEWRDLQARFWDSLRRLAAVEMTSGEGQGQTESAPELPWHEGLELWTRLFRPREEASATVERTLARARQLLAWMQKAAERAADHGGKLPGGEELAELMRDLAQAAVPDPFAWFSAWSVDRIGDLERLWQPFASLAGSLWSSQRADLERLLQAQPLGLLREHQERRQAIARAMVALTEAEARYRALLARALQRGIERFEEKLAARAENGSPVRSARELFDLWIDAGEEGFLEIASSEEFRRVYGDLVNAQCRLRRLFQAELELASRALGMPTRSELDGVLRKLKELRAAGARLEARVAALEAMRTQAQTQTESAPERRARPVVGAGRASKGRSANRRKES